MAFEAVFKAVLVLNGNSDNVTFDGDGVDSAIRSQCRQIDGSDQSQLLMSQTSMRVRAAFVLTAVPPSTETTSEPVSPAPLSNIAWAKAGLLVFFQHELLQPLFACLHHGSAEEQTDGSPRKDFHRAHRRSY
jgi:hypothetical protein